MRKIVLFSIFFVIAISNIAFGAGSTAFNLSKVTTRATRQEILDNIIENFEVRNTGNTSWQAKFDEMYGNLLDANSFSFAIYENLNASTSMVTTYEVFIRNIGVQSVPTTKNSIAYKNQTRHARFFKNDDTFNFPITQYNNEDSFYQYSNANFVYQLLLDQEGNYWEYSFTDFSISKISNFKFDDNYDVRVDLYNNTLENVLKRSYSVSTWVLGWVEEWGGYDYYQFDLIDNRYDTESPLYTLKIDSNKNTVGYSSGLVVTGNDLSIASRLIDYNIPYKLNIYLYSGDEVVKTFTYFYRWLPLNAVIGLTSGDTTGTIISTGSGDFNTQDSTNTIMDSSEVDNIINEYLSGDIEDIASEFGFTALDNPFTTFLLYILESTYDALTLREPVVLTASYNGMTFTLNSDDFITPESPIKTFIRSLLIFLYIYGNYKYFHYLITLVETAKINKVVNEIGTDEFHDSNIM